MPDHTVNVTFNYNNGNPEWTFNPESLPIPHGPNHNIMWLLGGTPGAVFADSGGIAFDKPGPHWPGTTPTKQGPKTYTASENNSNPGPGHIRYNYSASVVYNGTTYKKDPDVDNYPP